MAWRSLPSTLLATGSPHTVTAIYTNSDGNFTSGRGSATPAVAQDATSLVLASSPNASVFGQTVSFTATVTPVAPGSGTPTGTVDFKEGATDLTPGGITLVGGRATFSTSTLSVGHHTVSASYNGDSNFLAGNSSRTQTVNRAGTTTALSSSSNTSVSGQTVVFTATVSLHAPGAGTPTGTVDFKEGATDLTPGGVTLSNGHATFSISTLSVGQHTLTASYSGNADFTASQGTAPQVVNKASTRMDGLAVSPSPAVFGQLISITAVVSPLAPGKGIPTGTVMFLDGSTTLGSLSLTSGRATFTTGSLSRGNHIITARYSGDGNFLAIATPGYGELVLKDATTTVVTSSVNPAVVGHAVTFTATAHAGAPGSGKPTGTVTFKDITTVLGTATLNSAGQATFSTTTLAVGTHAITASYGGDTNFTGSFSPNIAEVVKASGGSRVSSPPPTTGNAGRTVESSSQPIPVSSLSPQSLDSFFDGSTQKHGVSSSRLSRPHTRVVKEDSFDWPM